MHDLSKAPALVLTERLRLRFPEPADAGGLATLADNPQIAAMTGTIPSPYEHVHAEAWIERVTQQRRCGETLAYVLCDKEHHTLMGVMSLNHFQAQSANFAYWLGEPFWGHGFCSEAGREMMSIAFDTLRLHALTAYYLQTNHASGRVLERLGFQFTEKKRLPHRGGQAEFLCVERQSA